MYLWILIWLGLISEISSHWEPCKIQCENNFKRNDLSQQALKLVCQKGCDLFNVAFVSTSDSLIQEHSDYTNFVHFPHRKTEVLSEIDTRIELEKSLEENTNNKIIIVEIPSSSKAPSTKKSLNDKDLSANQIVTKKSKPEKQVTSSSKTTVEPTSQPVQDHPVEASKQTTTTNGPRRDTAKTDKNKEKVMAVGQKSGEKHIAKHNPDLKKEAKMKIIPLGKTENHHSKKVQGSLKDILEQAKHSCRQECMVAYICSSEQEACVVGCHLQATTAYLKPPSTGDQEVQIQTASPFGMLQRVVSNMVSHIGRLIRISWSWASSSVRAHPPEKSQIYGSEVLPRHPQMPLFIGFRPAFMQDEAKKRLETIETLQEKQNNAFKLFNEEFFPHKVHPFDISITATRHHNIPQIITILKKESTIHHINREHQSHSNNQNQASIKPERKHHVDDQFSKLDDQLNLNNLNIASLNSVSSANNQRDDTDQQIQHQLDLLECISRKSGLPRWFIAITIFTSAIVVLWLCFSLTAPPDDAKTVKTKPPELETLIDENDEDDDEQLTCSEKKKLLARADDFIKIRIENV